MGIFSILLTGFALSMDAFAVSVTKGMTLKKINLSIATKNCIFIWTISSSYASYWVVIWHEL